MRQASNKLATSLQQACYKLATSLQQACYKLAASLLLACARFQLLASTRFQLLASNLSLLQACSKLVTSLQKARLQASYFCLGYIGHVVHTAVTDFYIVSVEYFMKFIILGEVHIYEIQEFSDDVCRDVFAEGEVEPYDFSISVAFMCYGLMLISGSL